MYLYFVACCLKGHQKAPKPAKDTSYDEELQSQIHKHL
jgi:hypothetical protein